jgi:hypothetical protein
VLRIRDNYSRAQILIFIHPGSCIPVLGFQIQQQQQKMRGKKIFLFLNKNFEPIHKELSFYPKKLSLSFQNYGFGIRDLEKPFPDPESRG